MNTTVSIEIAKVLKEMGFDEYTIAYYRQHTQNSYHLYYFKNKTGRSKGAKNSEIGKNHYQLTAPTIADVVMWLYEKHDIWIEVRKSYLLNQFVAVTKNPRIELSAKDSPTDAYEAAITHVLTNLI